MQIMFSLNLLLKVSCAAHNHQTESWEKEASLLYFKVRGFCYVAQTHTHKKCISLLIFYDWTVQMLVK